MLYQLLDSIKQKPALFLNQQSVMALHSFLLGWKTAKNIYQLPKDEDEHDFAGFQEWITQRYDIGSSQAWPRIITFFSRDEKESLNLFFDLLEEYRKQPPLQSTPTQATKEMRLAEAV